MDAALARPLSAVTAAGAAISDALSAPTDLLKRIVSQAGDVVKSPRRSRAALGPLGGAMGDLSEAEESTSQVHILHYHIAALAAAASAFAWVADPAPLSAVRRAQAAAKAPIAALSAKDALHRDFADAVDSFLDKLADFVKAHHQAPLAFADGEAEDSEARINFNAAPAVASKSSCNQGIGTSVYDDSHTAPHLTAYRDMIASGALADFLKASSALGGLITDQAGAVEKALAQMYSFLVAASIKKKPSSPEELQKDLLPIGTQMGVVAGFVSKCPPRDIIENHLNAVSEAINMMSWVTADSAPMSFVSDAEAAAGFYLNKVLTTTKSAQDASEHRAFVLAIRKLLADTKLYIKEFHTMGVAYNCGVHTRGKSHPSRAPVTSQVGDQMIDDNYLSKFNMLMDSSVAAYVAASNKIGAEVAEQAAALLAAFKAEADFLAKAISMPKPADFQSMLTPIATEMGNVAAIKDKMGPRDKLTNHCTAVAESVSALGWVAVDEKATAFVGDMAGAGQFFLDKVKMGAKSTNDPSLHREWAKSIETLFANLKQYVREYHTQKLTWNPPKRVRALSAVSQAAVGNDEGGIGDYVTVFEAFVAEIVVAYVNASESIGEPVAEQAKALLAAFNAEAAFLKKAISMPKPDDIQSLLAPIAAEMGKVSAITDKVDPRGPLTNHCTAVSESVSALGWVAVDEKATGFVGDMAGAGQFFLDKVKMGAKKTETPSVHREWAKCLEGVFSGLKSYVKEHHTQKLVWNPPKKSQPRSAVSKTTHSAHESSADYVRDFEKFISDCVAPYAEASRKIGGPVLEQANAVVKAFHAETALLKKAISMPKPDDIQSLLAPIAAEMGKVSAITEKLDPRGPMANHCTAVSESVSALGWVAVDEKATGFVGDMAGAGQFFLDKVKMGAKKMDNPSVHREWAKCLEGVFSGLKSYVKEHHTQKLVWNPKRAVKTSREPQASVPRALRGDYVSQFKELITGPLTAYMTASATLGGDVAEQAQAFKAAWHAEADLLAKAITMKKPDDIQSMVAPIAKEMGAVSAITERVGPRSPLSNHCSAVSESIPALGWVAVNEKAAVFVGDMASAGQFFLDKVKMGARNTSNPDAHREWAKSLELLFKELRAYVREHHTQKLSWKY